MAFYTIFWNNCVLETYRNMNSHVYKGCLHFFSFKFQQSENLYINTPGRVKQVTGFIKIMQCTWEYNQILATISFFHIKTWRTFVNTCDLWSWYIIIQFSYTCMFWKWANSNSLANTFCLHALTGTVALKSPSFGYICALCL